MLEKTGVVKKQKGRVVKDSQIKTEMMKQMFKAAIDAAQPHLFMADALPTLKPEFDRLRQNPEARLVVLGCGKASAAMAAAFEQIVPQALHHRLEGLVVVPDGHEAETQYIEICCASHPVPDERSCDAAEQMLGIAQALAEDDLLVMLISGGGSALCSLPQPQLSLIQKQQITDALLRAGADITQMNAVRKHLSQIKGGRLAAAAYPARCISFGISDVPGDDVSVIASGPTVGDDTSCADALEVIDRFNIDIPDGMRAALENAETESVFSSDPKLSHSDYYLLATPAKSLQAAAEIAIKYGYEPVILGDALDGESRILAAEMAQLAVQKNEENPTTPLALISGGETTVTVRGDGVGGRNVEFLHALALQRACFGLAGDTDGIDGGAKVAGAIITPDTLARAEACGADAAAMLENNDSHRFFEQLGDQIITGPTLTNVNDFRVVLV